MPVTTVSLTVEEYTGIMDRLAALEAALPPRSSDVEALFLRVQGIESTLSAFSKTVADVRTGSRLNTETK